MRGGGARSSSSPSFAPSTTVIAVVAAFVGSAEEANELRNPDGRRGHYRGEEDGQGRTYRSTGMSRDGRVQCRVREQQSSHGRTIATTSPQGKHALRSKPREMGTTAAGPERPHTRSCACRSLRVGRPSTSG